MINDIKNTIGLIYKYGFLASNLINIGAMQINKEEVYEKITEKNFLNLEKTDNLENSLLGGYNQGIKKKIGNKKYLYFISRNGYKLKKRHNIPYIVKNTSYKYFFNYSQPYIPNRYLQEFLNGTTVQMLGGTLDIFYKNFDKNKTKEDIDKCDEYINFMSHFKDKILSKKWLNKYKNDVMVKKFLEDNFKNYYNFFKELCNVIQYNRYDCNKIKSILSRRIKDNEDEIKECNNRILFFELQKTIKKNTLAKNVIKYLFMPTGDDNVSNQIYIYNDNKTEFIDIVPIDLDTFISNNENKNFKDENIIKFCKENQECISSEIKNIFDNNLEDFIKNVKYDVKIVYNEENISKDDEEYSVLKDLDNNINKEVQKFIRKISNYLLEGSNKEYFNSKTKEYLLKKSIEFKNFADNIK